MLAGIMELSDQSLKFPETPKYLCFFNLKCANLHWRRRKWHPTPVLLPGKSHGWRSLVGCCLWDHAESDTTEVT